MTSSLGVFVRVRAGLDIIRRAASWEFQTLDPLTGTNFIQSFLTPCINNMAHYCFLSKPSRSYSMAPPISVEKSVGEDSLPIVGVASYDAEVGTPLVV